MAAFFKTKRVTVSRPDGQLALAPGVARMVDIQPISAQVAYEQFGVDVKGEFQLFDDKDAETYYEVGGQLLHGAVRYSITGLRKWDTLETASHTHVLLEEVQDGA